MDPLSWATAALEWLGITTVRATLWMATALLAAALLRRSAAATRRGVWAATIAGLLLLPFASGGLRTVPLRVLSPGAGPAAAMPFITPPGGWPDVMRDPPLAGIPYAYRTSGPAAITPPPDVPVLAAPAPGRPKIIYGLLAVYAIGVALSLLRLARARSRAAGLVQEGATVDPTWQAPADLSVRESELLDLPLTVGSVAPVIVLPRIGRTWPASWRAAALAHEIAHVRARDPLLQLFAEFACALYWFHPLVHLAARQLRVERELAADDAALATGLPPSEYARLLVDLACAPVTPPAEGAVVPLLTRAGLKARLLGILDAARARHPRRAASVALAALGLIVFAPIAIALPVARGGIGVGRGELIGRVVDESSGRPVAKAEVVFRLHGARARTERVSSDGGGWFHYPHAAPLVDNFGVYARSGEKAARNHVLTMPYGTKLPITLRLAPGRSLGGQVRSPDGQPIAGARVRIIEEQRTSPGPGTQVLAESDAQGRWQIDGVLYGKFRLLVQAPWGVATTKPVNIVDGDVMDADVVIGQKWEVMGFVQDDAGRRMGGVRVEHGTMHGYASGAGGWQRFDLPGQRFLDWDVTEADGSFRLLRRGSWVMVRAKGVDNKSRFARFEDSAPGRPQLVTLRPMARVSGLVVHTDGTPAAGKRISLTQGHFEAADSPITMADADGHFTFEDVPFGEALWLSAGKGDRLQHRMFLQPGENRTDLEIEVP